MKCVHTISIRLYVVVSVRVARIAVRVYGVAIEYSYPSAGFDNAIRSLNENRYIQTDTYALAHHRIPRDYLSVIHK